MEPTPTSSEPSPPTEWPFLGAVHVLAFLMCSVFVLFGTSIVGGVLMSMAGIPQPDDMSVVPAWIMATMTIVQLTGWATVAACLSLVFSVKFKASFALRFPPILLTTAALFGGLTVGWFPDWLAEFLIEVAPWLSAGNLDAIASGIANASPIGRMLMIMAVCVVAPIAEELVFRGYLFNAISRSMPPVFAWLGTSLLFALFHMDPLHIISVLFTGLFLGWLRWMSKSIIPSIIAHAGNNILAALAVLFLPVDSTPWIAAVLGIGFTGVLAAVAFFARRKD